MEFPHGRVMVGGALAAGLAAVLLAAALLAGVAAGPAAAQAPADKVLIGNAADFPESVTSLADGTLIFGTTGKQAIYRALPGEATASVWIQNVGLRSVLGVFADEATGTLWACSNGARNSPDPTEVRAFDLATGAPKGTVAMEGGGTCNDFAVDADGTLFVTETRGGRIFTLKPGADAMTVWLNEPEKLAGIDGIAFVGGALYVNSVTQDKLYRIDRHADGTAAGVVELAPSQVIDGPDGMRAAADGTTLLLVEGGKLDAVTFSGDTASVTTLRDGLTGITAVTQVGNTAWVSEAKFSARQAPEGVEFNAWAIPLE